jgi:hypothetical protein
MRLEWTRFTREYQQALEEQIMQTLGPALDADVAAREEEELRRLQMEMQMQSNNLPDRELDALMADEIARQEEAEMQAMLEELEREQAQKAQEHQFSDDEYDDVFMELIQQQEEQGRSMAYSQDVEMSYLDQILGGDWVWAGTIGVNGIGVGMAWDFGADDRRDSGHRAGKGTSELHFGPELSYNRGLLYTPAFALWGDIRLCMIQTVIGDCRRRRACSARPELTACRRRGPTVGTRSLASR